jgi:hypothetical protein
MAQTVTYACQYVDNGGFQWKNGSWNLKSFPKGQAFFLRSVDGNLIPPDPNTSLGNPLAYAKCRPPQEAPTGLSNENVANSSVVQTCFDAMGNVLFFDHDFGTGTVADMIGGASARGRQMKDRLRIAPFVCEKVPEVGWNE